MTAGADDRTLSALLQERVSGGSRACWTFLDSHGTPVSTLSCAQLDRRAAGLARRLRPYAASSATPRAVLTCDTGPQFLIAFFGCLYAGLVPVPVPAVHPHRRPERLLGVLADATPALIVTDAAGAAALQAVSSSIPSLPTVIVVGGDEEEEDESRDGAERVSRATGDHARALAYLQYTSGSTSVPRGVMIRHGDVLRNLHDIDVAFRHTPDSVIVSWLPHFHDMGLVYGLLQPLYNECRAYILSPRTFIQQPSIWPRTMAAVRGTHSGGPDFGFELCARKWRSEDAADVDLANWQVAFNGAERIRVETLDAFASCFGPLGFRRTAFVPAYGLAEATLKVSSGEPGRVAPVQYLDRDELDRGCVRPGAVPGRTRSIVGCGRPAEGTTVLVVDPIRRELCDAGAVGELWVSGPAIAAGYWNRPEATAETFDARIRGHRLSYLRTGDLGYIDDGEVFVTGRLKDIILIRGANHYPDDIEQTARDAHPALRVGRGAAFSIEWEGAERLAVVHEIAKGAEADYDAVIEAIRSAVARDHELQAHVVALVRGGTLPTTSSGKVQRGACRDALSNDTLALAARSILPIEQVDRIVSLEGVLAGASSSAGARARLTQACLEIVARELGITIESLDPHRPLESVGLDSLSAARLSNRIWAVTGVNVSPPELIGTRSVTDVVTAILANRQSPAVSQVASPRATGPATLTDDQERLWALDGARARSSAYNICASVSIESAADVETLARAIGEVARRHEPLRSRVTDNDGRPALVIDEPGAVPVPCVDLGSVPELDREVLARRCIELESARPLSLAEGPVFRALWLRLGPDAGRLVITAHHLMADGESLRLFVREVAALCGSSLTGVPAVLPALGDGYYRTPRARHDSAPEDIDYWRVRLAGALPLTLDAVGRPPRGSVTFGQSRVDLGAERPAAVLAYAQDHATTSFAVLLAAFGCFMHALTRSHDLVIAVPMERRITPAVEPLIGLFAAPVPVRLDLSGDPSFADLVGRVARAVAEAQVHASVSYATIVNAWRSTSGGHGALTSVMFGYTREPSARHRQPGVDAGPLEIERQPADFDLFLTLQEIEGRLRGLITYDASRFSAATAGRWMDTLHAILDAALRAPGASVSELLRAVPLTAPVPPGQAADAAPTGAIVLSATFTCDRVVEPLQFWMRELGLPLAVSVAPYGQTFQALLDPAGVFARNRGGFNVTLLRLADWMSGETRPGPDTAPFSGGSSIRDDFIAALDAAAANGRAPDAIVLCPPPVRAQEPAFVAWHTSVEQELTRAAAALGISVIDGMTLAAAYDVPDWDDAYGDSTAHAPYSDAYSAAQATAIARALITRRYGPRKVIVVDCDQTLWSGVAAEDGIANVALDESRRQLQSLLVAQQQRGTLICLCSKNEEAIVMDTFRHHAHMPLRPDHLAAWRINWRPKSENLRELSEELGLGLDSMVFIDDDPIECAEVRHACPGVLTVEWPPNGSGLGILQRLWVFDRVRVTAEDRHRTAMYREERQRDRWRRESLTHGAFLRGLSLRVELQALTPEHLARAAQLTLRTNQFNTTGVRHTEADLRRLLARGDISAHIVQVHDRFGDYGMTGLVIARTNGTCRVDAMCLSCRVLGKGVEHMVLSQIAAIAHAAGCAIVEIEYADTGRNHYARKFLDRLADPAGADTVQGAPGAPAEARACTYRIPVPRVMALRADDLGPDASVELPAEETASSPASGRIDAPGLPAAVLLRAATEWTTAAGILQAVRASRAAFASASPSTYVPPRTDLQREVAEIWQDVLSSPRVGLHDSFFDLGGHSLVAVQVLSRVRSRFDVELPLSVVIDGQPTVEAMARAIEDARLAQETAVDLEDALRRVSALSDSEVQALLGSEPV